MLLANVHQYVFLYEIFRATNKRQFFLENVLSQEEVKPDNVC